MPQLLTKTPIGMVALFAFLCGMSLFFFRGILQTSDEVQMYLTARAIVERGSLEFEQEIYGVRFSGYGLGTPLVTIPFVLIDYAFQKLMPEAMHSFAPLVNVCLFGLLGVVLAGFLQGDRRYWAIALVLIFSPFLPASLTLYSELLSAFGLGLLALACYRATTATMGREVSVWVVAAFLAALASGMARIGQTPLTVLVLVWGILIGCRSRVLTAGFVGMLLAIFASLAQNQILRGSPFQSGYQGQDFTTPLGTGLFGLLLSPERGILIFFPVIFIPLLGWRHLTAALRALTLLALACLAFYGAMHGLFWTWHGGWTTGPRFLLPCLSLFVPAIAHLWLQRSAMDPLAKGTLYLTLAWSGLMAWIYCRYSAFAWWNMLWGFHQEENQWLFLPQLSLWQGWLQGSPIPAARPAFSLGWNAVLSGIPICLVALSIYPLILPYRGYVGTDPEARQDVEKIVRPRFFLKKTPLELILRPGVFMFLFIAIWINSTFSVLSGPRGWTGYDLDGNEVALPHLAVKGAGGKYEGWIDYPLNSPIKFRARANALYRVFIDNQLVIEQRSSMDQHLPAFEVPLQKGLHLITVEVTARPEQPNALFELYWTWGGGGRYLEPVGGEWLLPRPLDGREKFFSWFNRRKGVGIALLLALVLLLRVLPTGKFTSRRQ